MSDGKLLKEALALVTGPRAKAYGSMLDVQRCHAELFRIWLSMRKGPKTITPYDMAMSMILLKIARLTNTPGHHDSHVDIAGYAQVLDEVGKP